MGDSEGGAGEFAAASGGSAHSSRDKAFEIFVKRTITSIQKEAWGRSKEVKDIREACQGFLNSLEQHGCTEATLKEVLVPLQLGCCSTTPKVVELALGCLHKLVAHAWLHGESTASGTLDMLSAHGSLDEDDTVANVIKCVIKCGESTNEALQLAVVRALLTFATAEHFIAHGECLLAAVRAVFNLALGSDNPINKRTACNALLQMLNTICKRVTQIQPRLTGGSECGSRMASEAAEFFRAASAASLPNQSPRSTRGSGCGNSGLGFLLTPTAAQAAQAAGSGSAGSSMHGPGSGGASAAAAAAGHQQQQQLEAADGGAAGAPAGPPSAAAARAAQLAQLAESTDLRGLEAALEAAAPAEQDDDDSPSPYDPAELAAAAARARASADAANGATALAQHPSVGPPASAIGAAPAPAPQHQGERGSAPSTPHAPPTPHRHHGRSNRLSTQEKDVLLVLTAFCKLASREAPGGAGSDSVLAQGKLLALEMLAKVLSNSFHNWEHVPESFCRQLRQPLCLALLRNCAASDPAAYGLALRLLMALLCLPRLRAGLRAELGAFYPLLVLRSLEAYAPPGAGANGANGAAPAAGDAAANALAALGALQGLTAEPQLLVDLYVNFDCDLQASNLFERTAKEVSRLAQAPPADAEGGKADKRAGEAAAAAAGIRKQAQACCLQLISAMETWAKPIRDAALRAADADGCLSTNGQGGFPSLPSMERDSSHGSLSSATAKGGRDALSPRSPAGQQQQQQQELSEAERLAAAKSTKEALAKGISLFNSKGPLKGLEALIGQGLVEGSPAAVASFLRTHHGQLDRAQLGELLGHHEEFAVAVMHGWVDSEPSMAGGAIDACLRRLLAGFRLPGEAQKIDRIMEKFAERYCKDNPSRFANADAAYMLSFAVIMLNTDAHNPLAERRLAKADFVSMAHAPAADGSMVPVLPPGELGDIFDRVVGEEIVVRGDGGAAASREVASSRASTRNRLAAAMGWTALLQPFRALAGSTKGGRDSDNAQAHRRYLQEVAEREVLRASASGNVWCSAGHPEHVRPMLQVGGPLLLRALSSAFDAAPDAAGAAPALAGLLQLARLSGLLGLDRQCEACAGALAERCGVSSPAPAASAAEGKQLAALQALLGLTAGPEAGFLGSSWVTVLRCVSALDALKHELTRLATVPAAPPPQEAPSSNPLSRMFASMFGTGSATTSPTPSGGGATSPPARASASGGGAAHAAGDATANRDSLDGSRRLAPAVRNAPGAGLVLWAESAAGAAELERPYARSTSLDGDAVVVFMRALCAVSQEELEAAATTPAAAAAAAGAPPINIGTAGRPFSPSSPGKGGGAGGPAAAVAAGPRLYSLQKVVECAYANMPRIRLVWGKLWAVIAAQLVGASCHPSRRVALYAVDSLRQLVAKLLSRSELEHFTHQEEALKPFVAVLRQCDEACVRELAVQCVMQAVSSHAGGLGSGWRMVILALRLGAADSSPAVMAQAQEALQAVVEDLYAGGPGGGGHAFLRETVQAIVAGVRNPAHLELSMSAVQLLGRCSERLAEYEDAGGRDDPPAAAAGGAPGGVDLDGDYGWGLLLRTLADVLQHDRRPQLADAALEMLLALLAQYSGRWDAAAWRVLIQRVLQHMLALPPAISQPAPTLAVLRVADAAGATGAAAAAAAAATAGRQRAAGNSFTGFPLSQAAGSGAAAGPAAAAHQGAVGTAAAAAAAALSPAEAGILMTTLLQRMDRYYPLLCDQAVDIRAEFKVHLILQLAAIGVSWYQQTSIYLSTAGIKALMRLAEALAAIHGDGAAGECGWALLLDPVEAAVRADVDLVVALATRQLAEQQQPQQQLDGSAPHGGGAALAAARALKPGGGGGGPTSGGASPSGSPRAGAGGARSPFGSPLGAKGGAAARQALAAAAAQQQLALQLRVRTQQLVLMQRGLASVHRRCGERMSWDEQMQLLDVLALGVDAAISFNARLAGQQQLEQQQQLLRQGSLPAAPAAGALAAVPEGRQQLTAAAPAASDGLSDDSLSFASLATRSGSSYSSSGGLVSFGSYMHPHVSGGGASSCGGAGDGSSGGADGAAGPAAAEADAAGPSVGEAPSAADEAVAGSTVAPLPPPAQQQQQQQRREQQQEQQQPQQQQQEQRQQRLSSASAGSGAAAIPLSVSSPSARLAAVQPPCSPGRVQMGGVALPVLLVTSPESVEVVSPALMRLEAEGGLLLIEALNHSLAGGGAEQAPAAARTRQRLIHLVRSIIQSEAACSSANGAARENPLQDALAGNGWEHAARAPLVVAALRVLSGLHGAEYRREVLQLFPSLCRLMCSNHLLTRAALAGVLGSREFAELLPAASAAAGTSPASGGGGGGGAASPARAAVAAGSGEINLLL